MNRNKVCKYCSGENDPSAIFCVHCGGKQFAEKQSAPVQPVQPQPQQQRPQQTYHQPAHSSSYHEPVHHYKRNSIVGAIVGVIVVIIIISIIASSLSSCSTAQALSPATFRQAAASAGYWIDEDSNYDGFYTHWIGAHKMPDSQKGDPEKAIYIIDYTQDTNEANAEVEYRRFVGYLSSKIPGSTSKASSGSNWRYQVNENATHFGIAYRIGRVNILVMGPIDLSNDVPKSGAPKEYKQEVFTFITGLGYSLPKL